jgi:O-antigen/teichoic acid export membrane protein
MSLKQQTFSAVRWTTVAMAGKAGLQFLQVAILARLLTPADFGLMALVLAVIAFAQIFADLGVSNAIVHHQKISQEELSSLYWLNVASGAVLMFLVMGGSWLVASFYGAPVMQPLLMVISVYFLVSALGQQLRVVAQKNLRFATLARIDLSAALAGAVVAVVWALLSPSVASLVAGQIASVVVTTALCWIMLADGWRPMLRLRLREIRHFLSFGGYIMASNLVNTFNSQADVFIGGRILSATSLGVYSLPRDFSLRLAKVINPIVTKVGLPVMAKAQHDQVFLKKVYLKTLRMTASVNFPIYMAMAVFAPEVVTLLFGPQWTESVLLLRVLALWGMIRSTGNPIGSLLYAKGRADLAFKWNLALLFLIVPALWFGSQWGSLGLAVSQLALMTALYVPGWYCLVRPLCGSGLGEYSLNLAIPLITATGSAAVAYGSVAWLHGDIFRLLLGLVVGGLGYLALSWLLNRVWLDSIFELIFKKRLAKRH